VSVFVCMSDYVIFRERDMYVHIIIYKYFFHLYNTNTYCS